MLSDQTVRGIRAHAGLDGDPLDATTVSGALVARGDIDAVVDAFVACLQRLNVELNGSRPSEHVGDKESLLPRGLVYAVSEVARMLRDDGQIAAALLVDTAWLAVLAGDIDDLAAYLTDEGHARSE